MAHQTKARPTNTTHDTRKHRVGEGWPDTSAGVRRAVHSLIAEHSRRALWRRPRRVFCTSTSHANPRLEKAINRPRSRKRGLLELMGRSSTAQRASFPHGFGASKIPGEERGRQITTSRGLHRRCRAPNLHKPPDWLGPSQGPAMR
eukprot:scaffold143894_cov27-Tisochrysis_lutea.AAC.3